MKELIASKLKSLRNAKGYSAEYVVTELQKLGTKLSTVTLYGYENGVSQPKADTFLQICKIYGVSSFDIFFDESPCSVHNNYDNLNELGKQKADEYIDVLSENKKYTEKNKSVSDDIIEELKQDAEKNTINTK